MFLQIIGISIMVLELVGALAIIYHVFRKQEIKERKKRTRKIFLKFKS